MEVNWPVLFGTLVCNPWHSLNWRSSLVQENLTITGTISSLHILQSPGLAMISDFHTTADPRV